MPEISVPVHVLGTALTVLVSYRRTGPMQFQVTHVVLMKGDSIANQQDVLNAVADSEEVQGAVFDALYEEDLRQRKD
jgi:hypothetical protein